MVKKTKLKVGVIGVGYMGQYHTNVLASMLTHKLVGVYDINKKRADQIAEKYETHSFRQVEALLNKIDAAVISVPTNYHYQYAKLAIEYDCHILVEKPITQNLEQARSLIQLAEDHQKLLQVGHIERFNGAVIELNKIVTDPLMIETRRASPFAPRIKDVGVVLDMLIHDLDIVLNLVKSPVVSFQSSGRIIESEHEDICTINIDFQNTCLATLMASRVSQKKERTLRVTQNQNLIVLNYENQDIEIYRQASSAYLITKEELKYSQESFVEKLHVHKDNPLKSEHQHFYECIIGKQTPIISNDKDIETLAIALDAIQQIKEHCDDDFHTPLKTIIS